MDITVGLLIPLLGTIAPASPGTAAVIQMFHCGYKALTAYAHMAAEMEAQRAAHAESRTFVVEIERGVVSLHRP